MTKSEGASVQELLEQKLLRMREILAVTQQGVLLVDLEGLTPLLERKNSLIGEIQAIDRELELSLAVEPEPPPAAAHLQAELAELVQAVLENERTLEMRIEQEHTRLRQELREFDRETRLKQYLERARPKGGRVSLKR